MAEYHRPDAKKLQALRDIANKIRIHSIRSTNASKSGHPTSCCSAAEILSVLFFNTMRYSVLKPRNPASDRFVMSKGHAAPALYGAWVEAGLFPAEDLNNLRKIDSDLEGHPTPRLNFIDVATGSLGQGLSCAAGMAYTGKNFDKSDYRVYCLVGDGESAEGSIWEALAFSSDNKLDNLVAIFDVNRLGQSAPTALEHDMEAYRKRVESFGWNTYVVDGHDVESLSKALYDASTVKGRPTCILAKTFKGKGIPGVENELNFHGKPLGSKADAALEAISKLIDNQGPHGLCPEMPTATVPAVDISNIRLAEAPSYKMGEKVALRLAYGVAITKLGQAHPRVISLDADVKNSTFADKFMAKFPDRYIENYIAEQNMVGVAIGCATRDRTVAFVSTFAAFLARSFDQVRMGAVSQTNVNFAGTHVGVAIGPDGPSQMALEDIASFRAIPGSTVFYPSDAVSTERAVELAANQKGICFIRVSRSDVPVVYENETEFSIGKAKIVRQSDSDQVTVIGAGITLVEALKAADLLSESGINIRVIDPFTVKPMDAATIINSAKQTGGRIVTAEDHYAEGGLGEAVMAAVSEERDIVVRRLAVTGVPRSGQCDELLEMFGISHNHIIKAVKEVMKL